MIGKGFFKTIAMIPILVPSLLSGIALVYLFGNQGVIKSLLFGYSIYGTIGIIIAESFYTFPHALLIIMTAFSIADARMYEAAISLRASRPKIFFTVTLPGVRYGLISAAFVVFTLVITDFGIPKVIGGKFNVLAVDVYKQVVGQQNFQMGAVVSVVLLIPAMLAFTVDRIVQKKQITLLSSRAVVFAPKKNIRFDSIKFEWYDTGNRDILLKAKEKLKQDDEPNILEKPNEAIWFVEDKVIKFCIDEMFIHNRAKRSKWLKPYVPKVLDVHMLFLFFISD